MALLIGLLLYGAPVLAIALLAPRAKLDRKVSAALLFGTPALGCVAYVLWLRLHGQAPGPALELYYPLTILPLGLWAMCLGTLEAALLGRIRRPLPPGLTALAGCAAGVAFVWIYVALGSIGQGSLDHLQFTAWLAAGTLAGGLSAAMVAAYVASPALAQAHQQ